jgi:glycosyltransferase involved in cell wall biosynthesis
MKKNILICGEHLNDGGVETAIVNDALILKKRGYNVYVLAARGIYTETLEKEGIENIDFKMDFVNGFDMEKAEKIIKIIKQKEIDEAHIHKFISIPSCLPAFIIANIPYVVHLHEGLVSSYDWVMNQFSSYRDMLNIYFKNAYKIIAITENVKKYNMNLFNISEGKYIVIHNSINLKMFDYIKKENFPIKKFLLISRLCKEKEQSIKNGIELFNNYSKEEKECSLRIVGSGSSDEKIKSYVRVNNYKNIYFVGRSSEIAKEIANSDIVLGLGRCIIEAMASKRICCIIGYENLKSIIKKDNIEQAMLENFSGRGLPNETIDSVIKQIKKMKKEQLNTIVDENYEFVKKKLDLEKNIYTISENEKINYRKTISDLFYMISNIQQERDKQEKEKEEIWKAKVWLEEKYNI